MWYFDFLSLGLANILLLKRSSPFWVMVLVEDQEKKKSNLKNLYMNDECPLHLNGFQNSCHIIDFFWTALLPGYCMHLTYITEFI